MFTKCVHMEHCCKQIICRDPSRASQTCLTPQHLRLCTHMHLSSFTHHTAAYWCTMVTEWSLLPLIAIHASFFLLCAASWSNVTSRSTPPTPVRSTPEWPSLTQSMSEWPGSRATLLRGLPAKIHLWIHQRVLSLRNETSRQPLGPSTFCAAWFGGHLGPAPAPRHNANRYPGAVYNQTARDAQPRAKSSPLYPLYLCFCLILLPAFS
jgi:hypothetical protein